MVLGIALGAIAILLIGAAIAICLRNSVPI